MLFDTLRKCKSVVSILNLSNNQLDDNCMKSLGEYLEGNDYLIKLFVGGRQITDKGIKVVSEYLTRNNVLKILYFTFHKGITDASVPFLVKMIESTHLEVVLVNSTSINHINAIEIALACNKIKYGEELSISGGV